MKTTEDTDGSQEVNIWEKAAIMRSICPLSFDCTIFLTKYNHFPVIYNNINTISVSVGVKKSLSTSNNVKICAEKIC